MSGRTFFLMTAVVLLTASLLTACQPLEPIASSTAQAAEDDSHIGKQIAGSYIVEGREFGFPGDDERELVYRMLVTFTAEGAVFYEASMAFGADHPPRFKSGGHGTWQQTGPHEITYTTLSFDYGQEELHDGFGPYNPYSTTVRASNVATFGENFETYTETGTVAILPSPLNPLDSAAEPIFPPLQSERAGTRIPATFGNGN